MMIAEDAPGRVLVESEWEGCYSGTWNQAPLIPEAYAHPAKVAYKLAERIITHMLDKGYIEAGQTVVDPFAGVAGFAFHTMLAGMNFVGVELEEKFVNLARQNIELWQSRYGEWFEMGQGVVLQGDSRQLAQVISAADGVISSPPYAEGLGHHGRTSQKELDEGYPSPQFGGYGSTNGQLASMKEGNHADAVLSSPPYADAVNGNGEGTGARYDFVHHSGDNATKKSSQAEYGRTPGNLGNMSGGFDAAVSSPPFESSTTRDGRGAADMKIARDLAEKYGRIYTDRSFRPETYGETLGNIGNDQGETFWTAARAIVEQVYSVLKPGGYAAWVTGNFKRNGKIVDFGGQWLQLCEACGFIGVEHITAWKVERRGNQLDIFGNAHSRDVQRVSFFRRLSNEKDPDNAILSEDVWIVRKPFANGDY